MKLARIAVLTLFAALFVSLAPAQEVTPSSIPTGSATNSYGPYAYRDSPQALFIYKLICGEYGSPLSGTLTCLWNDNQDSFQMFASGSPTATPIGRLQNSFTSLTAQTAVTSVTTAQTMGSFPALPTGYHNVAGRTLRVCGEGVYTSPGTTTPTMTFSVLYGGITPLSITSAAISATATTNAPFHFCGELTAVSTGATGTLESHGALDLNIAANAPAAAIARYLDTNTAVSSSINLTASNTVALQVAASSSISSVTLRHATLEVLGD